MKIINKKNQDSSEISSSESLISILKGLRIVTPFLVSKIGAWGFNLSLTYGVRSGKDLIGRSVLSVCTVESY